MFEVRSAVDHLQVTSNVKLRRDFALIVPVCTASVPLPFLRDISVDADATITQKFARFAFLEIAVA